MRVKHWLIGCALCFAGIGGAAATTADGRELDNAQHGASESSSARETGISDAQGMIRDGNPHSHAGDNAKSTGGGNGDHAGGDSAAPARTQPAHLGWQSLLPGSIQ